MQMAQVVFEASTFRWPVPWWLTQLVTSFSCGEELTAPVALAEPWSLRYCSGDFINGMRSVLVLAASIAPLLSVVAWTALPGEADSRSFTLAELPPLPVVDEKITTTDQPAFWFRLQQRTALSRLAAGLDLPSAELARINDQPESHVFRSGSWFAIPAEARERASMLVSVEADSIRTQPPITPPPPVQSTASIQRGDSLASFLERHGINQEELKQFNPGLTLSDLSVGTEVRVAKPPLVSSFWPFVPTSVEGPAGRIALPSPAQSPPATTHNGSLLQGPTAGPQRGCSPPDTAGDGVGCTRELTLLTAPERLFIPPETGS